jgi:hypothetical protein
MSSSGTIGPDQMMKPMLAACPSFFPRWKVFLSDWAGNPILEENGGDGTLPIYLALGDLSDHLIRCLEADETHEFEEVFGVVEKWINHGTHYVSEAAVVGLLEPLLQSQSYHRATPREFIQWLGPQSRKWWSEVIDYWRRFDQGKFRPLSLD